MPKTRLIDKSAWDVSMRSPLRTIQRTQAYQDGKKRTSLSQGEAVCGESRTHGFEAEGRKVTSCSTVTVVGNK
ncbi:MAG: hypothetical protein ACRC8K_09180 [Waterburya sp.]